MQISVKNNLTYKVKKNDTLKGVANKFNLDANELKTLNKIEKLSVGDTILLSKSYEKSYVVKPLDTVSKIAKYTGESEEKIKKLTNNKKLFVGQKIFFSK